MFDVKSISVLNFLFGTVACIQTVFPLKLWMFSECQLWMGLFRENGLVIIMSNFLI